MNGTEFKQKFFEKIAWVNLIWNWEREYYSPTNLVAEFENNKKMDVVVGWYVTQRDPDYSFNGCPTKAIDFMDSYDLWDDLEESDIHDMVLEKVYSEYDSDPPTELRPQDFSSCTKIDCVGLCCWKYDRLISVGSIGNVKRIFRKSD